MAINTTSIASNGMNTITTEISARHIHLSSEDWQQLFGDQSMTTATAISQAPQFLAVQRVTLRGPKGMIERVGVVGPTRAYTQVELAASEARLIGIVAPLSESGRLKQAGEITIVGDLGEITRTAAIIQRRHIHANPSDIERNNLKGATEVSVRFAGVRGGQLDHILIRVHPSFTWRLHIDTDEANALGIQRDGEGEVIQP